MKNVIFAVMVLFIAGCAGSKNYDGEINALRSQVAELQSEQLETNQSLELIKAQLTQTMDLVDTVQNQITQTLTSSAATDYQVYQLFEIVKTLQVIAINQQTALAQLQTNLTVVKVIDFCGPEINRFNEVGLRLSDGTTIVFFQHGASRFLTTLAPSTSYTTTDGTNCAFSTNSQGLVCDNKGCR